MPIISTIKIIFKDIIDQNNNLPGQCVAATLHIQSWHPSEELKLTFFQSKIKCPRNKWVLLFTFPLIAVAIETKLNDCFWENIHRWRPFVAADNTKPGFMRAASNLNGPFYVTLQLHQTSSNLCKKGRKANFISTILLHGMKQHLYQNAGWKSDFCVDYVITKILGVKNSPKLQIWKTEQGNLLESPQTTGRMSAPLMPTS